MENHEEYDFDEELWKRVYQLESVVTQRMKDGGKYDNVHECLVLLEHRASHACMSIQVLLTKSKYDPDWDVVTLIRVLLDISIQAEYMIQDSSLASERAEDYDAFYWIEKHRIRSRVIEGNTPVSKWLRTRPNFEVIGARLKQQYEKVLPRFVSDKKKPRRNWYKGTLASIAKEAGRKDEYLLYHSPLSGSAHGSLLALRDGVMVERKDSIRHAIAFYLRIIHCLVRHHAIELDIEDRHFLVEAQKLF